MTSYMRDNFECYGNYYSIDVTESYDIYTFVLESLFQMSTYRTKGTIHAICSDKCMPKTILIQ